MTQNGHPQEPDTRARSGEEMREIAGRMRDVYAELEVAQRNLATAYHRNPDITTRDYVRTTDRSLAWSRGTLGILLHDLERGTRPLRNLMTRAPYFFGERGDTATGEK